MTIANKAGAIKNVRKAKWVNVVYWTILYTFIFMSSTKYFIYEDGILSFNYSMTMLYQHVALLTSIIIGFIFIRRHQLNFLKRVLCALAAVMMVFAAVFQGARDSLIYLIALSLLLGILADCSLLTYIYEMNNSERLFGIVLCHLLVAAVGFFCIRFNRTTAEFWWLMFALALAGAVACFLEKTDGKAEVAVAEPFRKKLYFPLILACVGGVSAVCSSMIVVSKLVVLLPYTKYFFYGGAALGTVVYFLEYRFLPRPATGTLSAGFAGAALTIFCYYFSRAEAVLYLAAAFAGATFDICMMNLYYILCNIIKKYKDSPMFKTAPIVSNFVGMAITVVSTVVMLYASSTAVKVVLAVCLLGDVVVLATSPFWEKGVSVTAKQEEYVRFDTTLTKEQAYRSAGLTEKEMEIVALLLEGLSLREVANKLFISENTAKTHRASVYRKMQVSSREELLEKTENLL
ncbi:MAG: hypothetical protein J5774_04475 [Clostridia bacterium]|nr:hypothetical protein [Clostridia bacterium]